MESSLGGCCHLWWKPPNFNTSMYTYAQKRDSVHLCVLRAPTWSQNHRTIYDGKDLYDWVQPITPSTRSWHKVPGPVLSWTPPPPPWAFSPMLDNPFCDVVDPTEHRTNNNLNFAFESLTVIIKEISIIIKITWSWGISQSFRTLGCFLACCTGDQWFSGQCLRAVQTPGNKKEFCTLLFLFWIQVSLCIISPQFVFPFLISSILSSSRLSLDFLSSSSLYNGTSVSQVIPFFISTVFNQAILPWNPTCIMNPIILYSSLSILWWTLGCLVTSDQI